MSEMTLNNLSQEGSAPENNLSSDSEDDYNVLVAEVKDHQLLLQLLRTFQAKCKSNATTIKDLGGKLFEAESQLLIHKEKAQFFDEKCRDKGDLIATLKASIQINNEMTTRNAAAHDMNIKLMQNRITELQNALDTQAKDDQPNSGTIHDTQLEKFQEQIADYKRIIELNESTICQLKEKVTALETKVKLDATIIENKNHELAQVTNSISTAESTILKLKKEVTALETTAQLAEINIKQKDEQTENKSSHRGYKITNLVSTKLIEITGLAPFAAPFKDIPCRNGNGWMVVQRRFDGSVNFSEGSYIDGFGSLAGEFWLGLEKLYILTNITPHMLHIQLVDFDDNTWYAEYDHFIVGNKICDYNLVNLGYYSGNAGDALRNHVHEGFNKWWVYKKEVQDGCNLNGKFYASTSRNRNTKDGIYWGTRGNLKSCTMLLKSMFI
ncbi:fibrinogen-like protein 1 isoform X1 [Drosophila pseudoobscura]|uniref:Fibrinogen-like protein 1 isoform X1 n=1 Tax=Drosophila pseudoobscura pseudoobscura TaxID=46245 RepID=A0A6I8W5V5_DROPS|nr:fibrinogen-like protein 1 isoform X1 [Drosophila pseudoobscura]